MGCKMTKSIGFLSPKEIKKRTTIRVLRQSRKINKSGTLLGSAIVTGIKAIPGVTWARCDIRVNKKGLFAVRDGVFIQPVSDKIVNDSSFKGI